jgi:hypothetical protein
VTRRLEYNKSLQKAGVLLGLDGLLPPSTRARISFTDAKATVTDGPFAEAKEAIGGYWILQVRSREEAIEWAKRAPMANNKIIEVRQIYERCDFPAGVQKAAELLKLGRLPEARAELQRAIAMTENRREQDLLSEKLKQIADMDA